MSITKKFRSKFLAVLNWSQILNWWPIILVGLGLSYHLKAAFTQNLFGDEIWTIFFANSYSGRELLFGPALEAVHPNTYYWLFQIGQKLGLSIIGWRLFTASLFGLGLIILNSILKSWRISWPERLIFFSLWTISPYLLRFSFLLRMYAPAMLIWLISVWLLNKFFEHQHWQWWLAGIGVDLLGLSLVYGYWWWLVIKFLALISNCWLGRHWPQPARWFTTWAGKIALCLQALVVISLGVGLVFYYGQEGQNLATVYLAWIPPLKVVDLGLGLASLLGWGYYHYFEGVVAARPIDLILGWCFWFGYFGLLLAGSWWIVKFKYNLAKTSLLKIKHQLTHFQLLSFGQLILVNAGWLLAGLWLVSWLAGWKLFHIRQLFVWAMIFTLGLGYLMVVAKRYRWWLGMGLLFVWLVLPLRHLSNYYLGPNQAYVHHFDYPVTQPILFGGAELELAYKQCQASRLTEIKALCATKNIWLVADSQDLAVFNQSMMGDQVGGLDGDQVDFLATPAVYQHLQLWQPAGISCHGQWRDYWQCQLDRNYFSIHAKTVQ